LGIAVHQKKSPAFRRGFRFFALPRIRLRH